MNRNEKNMNLGLYRAIALIVLITCAAVSLVLMLNTGRNNRSVLLIMLFGIWVLSPYIGLMVGNFKSNLWPTNRRITLYSLIIIITLGSLIFYSGFLKFPNAKPAAVYLIVPLVSWILIAVYSYFSIHVSENSA